MLLEDDSLIFWDWGNITGILRTSCEQENGFSITKIAVCQISYKDDLTNTTFTTKQEIRH